ncbi:MAG: hypothetical protein FJ151_01695 [Euryarchaeota archaeon]|nr:hypothetical protein [Euryarchaeota archaeon]
MADAEGKVERCEVEGCSNPAERSVAGKLAGKAGLAVDDSQKRVHLCKDHYRQLKKATRKEREFESLGR